MHTDMIKTGATIGMFNSIVRVKRNWKIETMALNHRKVLRTRRASTTDAFRQPPRQQLRRCQSTEQILMKTTLPIDSKLLSALAKIGMPIFFFNFHCVGLFV